MSSNLENRNKTRFDHEAAVTLENEESGVQRGARMYNYSDCGLYIETDLLLESETEIRIGISNSPFASQPDNCESYHGMIRWRKDLKRSAYYYGYGIEITEKDTTLEDDQSQDYGSRQHPRADYVTPVKYESANDTFEGTTENVSSGGVFIKTLDPVAVGQKITIDIPLKKKGKIKRLTGKVTRSTRDGFGAKFVRSK
ncbi:MAG: PilZ domain-containing protein [bacterium]|nr:PilZ domain-containing protein [bacterium]